MGADVADGSCSRGCDEEDIVAPSAVGGEGLGRSPGCVRVAGGPPAAAGHGRWIGRASPAWEGTRRPARPPSAPITRGQGSSSRHSSLHGLGIGHGSLHPRGRGGVAAGGGSTPP